MIEHYTDDWTRLVHGDGLDLLRSLDDASIDAVITDPPYNVSARSGRDGTTPGTLKRRDGSTRCLRKDFGSWDRRWEPQPFLAEASRVLRPGGSLIAFVSEHVIGTYMKSGLTHRNVLVWVKSNPNPAFPKLYVRSTELAVWQVKGESGWVWNADGYTLDAFTGPSVVGSQRCHPNQKPEWLMRAIIERHTNPGELIVDPYAGSGSTLVAAKFLGRLSVGSENDSEHCDNAARRLLPDALEFEATR